VADRFVGDILRGPLANHTAKGRRERAHGARNAAMPAFGLPDLLADVRQSDAGLCWPVSAETRPAIANIAIAYRGTASTPDFKGHIGVDGRIPQHS